MKEQGKGRRGKATAAAEGDDAKTVVRPDRTDLGSVCLDPPLFPSFSSPSAGRGRFWPPRMDTISVKRPHHLTSVATTSANDSAKVVTAESFSHASSQTPAIRVFWDTGV